MTRVVRSRRARRRAVRSKAAHLVVCTAVVLAALLTAQAGVDASNAAFSGTTSAALSAAAAPDFHPLPVTTGLGWWLDSSFTASLFTNAGCTTEASSGSTVRCWRDRRGTNSITTSSTAPVVATSTIAGHHPVYFSGFSALAGPDLFGGTETSTTTFVVFKEVARIANALVSLNGTNLGTVRFSLTMPWSNSVFHYDPGNAGNYRANSVGGLTSVGSTTLVTAWQDPVAARNYLRINRGNQAQSSATGSASTAGGLRLGSINSSYEADHQIAELLVYDRTLSAAERTQVENYLKAKWGTP